MIQGQLEEPILLTDFLPHFSKYRFIQYRKHDSGSFHIFLKQNILLLKLTKKQEIFYVVISYTYISYYMLIFLEFVLSIYIKCGSVYCEGSVLEYGRSKLHLIM